MVWLTLQLLGPLLAAFGAAALAGWAWHVLHSARRESDLEAERARLLREIVRLAHEGADVEAAANIDQELDLLRRRSDLVSARVAELERALETARAEADHAVRRAVIAEAAAAGAGASAQEIERLRAEVDAARAHGPGAIEVEAEPVGEDIAHAQSWRLRYFEQRVRYLENRVQHALPAPPPAPTPVPVAPFELKRLEWRARHAEARARYLEEAARVTRSALAAPPAPAAPADDDVARWRIRYLERRAAYLAAERLAERPAPEIDEREAERLKWRTRFLEARARHLERLVAEADARPAASAPVEAAPAAAPVEQEEIEEAVDEPPAPRPAPLVEPGAERRPPSLAAARDGAPDDLTLIEGVSPMGQSTLNSLGVYHFDQIAAWRPEHVAWVDQYLRLRGRILEEQWVEQAALLAREGPLAFKRAFEAEPA